MSRVIGSTRRYCRSGVRWVGTLARELRHLLAVPHKQCFEPRDFAHPHIRLSLTRVGLAVISAIACSAAIDAASAQSCTVAADSTVTLTSGTCAIDPNTTLTGTPAVHASTNAQIRTNNVNIDPFNGGSIGGLATRSAASSLATGRASTATGASPRPRKAAARSSFSPGRPSIQPSAAEERHCLLTEQAH